MNEARIVSSLTIKSGSTFSYPAGRTTFSADVTNARGPTPGLLSVSTEVQVVDLSLLTQPALCVITNLSETETLEVGLMIGSLFYPIDDYKPGEKFVRRLSKYLRHSEGISGSGTGTSDSIPDSELAVRTRGSAGVYSDILVECFDE